jgi:3-oxoadipate CoA-transferase alpha subunit
MRANPLRGPRAIERDTMINKIAASVAEALADVRDGATVLIGGFGTAGIPGELIDGLIAQGARDLTVVNNNAGNGDTGLAALLARPGACARSSAAFRARPTPRVRRPVPRRPDRAGTGAAGQPGRAHPRRRRRHRRLLHAHRLRHRTGAQAMPTKETRVIDGRDYVLEYPIHGDVALIKAERGDRWGNLTYRKAARNFGPVMATAAKRTVASVHEVVELGSSTPRPWSRPASS